MEMLKIHTTHKTTMKTVVCSRGFALNSPQYFLGEKYKLQLIVWKNTNKICKNIKYLKSADFSMTLRNSNPLLSCRVLKYLPENGLYSNTYMPPTWRG